MVRWSSRYLFLTYPQSDFHHQELHDHLNSLPNVNHTYSCRERHRDGATHFHAIVAAESKFNIRNDRFFDFRGRHPNIAPVRNLTKSNDYIAKDGVTLGEPINNAGGSKRDRYASILSSSNNADEFMRGIRESEPVDYILHHERLERFAEKNWKKEITYGNQFNRDQFTVPYSMEEWVNTQLFNGPERPKSLVIIGEPGTGKTKWAMSLGVKFNYWHGYFTGRRTIGARYAILDDFDHMKQNELKGLWGAQEIIGVKTSNGVSGHKQWEWGIPSIVLWNQAPEWFDPTCYEWKRSIVVHLRNNKLY